MFLDIGVGILIAVGVSSWFHIALSPTVIFASIIFALLPDVDFWVEFFKHKSVGGTVIREHRELFHFPLVFIPLTELVWFFAGSFWATLFGLGIFAHFLHDSIPTLGWGIKWFWPFSRKSYKLFAGENGRWAPRLYIAWTPEELEKTAALYGDPDWIKNFYLHITPTLITELLVLFIAMIALVLYTRGV